MPRSHQKKISWHVLALSLVFTVFVSLVMVETGAEGLSARNGSQFRPGFATGFNPQQSRRKNIASVRSLDNSNSSRVLITSDVPLNDYAAYWSGDRYYVVIPDADIISRDIQSMQSSLRGRGYQDVRIERKGNDVIISFRLLPGMRARVEQKFNRLEVVFTPPAGSTFGTDGGMGRPTGGTGTTAGSGQGRPTTGRPQDVSGGAGQSGTGQTRPTQTGTGSLPTNTYGTSATGTGNTSGNTSQTGATASSGGRTGRRGGSRGSSYGSGGGGGGGGGPALNIPLPSEMQPDASTSPLPSASPSPDAEAPVGISSPLPHASPLSTPAEIAQNQPQQPIAVPPSTATNPPVPAPAATSTGFAAAVRENWLPLLIGLLVLLAIGLLMVSRSRAERGDTTATDSSRLATAKKETIKEKPVSKLGAALAGGAAGAATAAAAAKESRTRATPVKDTVEQKKETKAVEPVVPAASVEQVGTEVKNLLEGKNYDEAVIGSANADTRQMVSTELLAALASRNPERRLRAREAFTKHGFFDDATSRLRTGDLPAVRISAARALGLTQDHAATPHLTAALDDTDAEVRRAAVNALAEIRDPSAIGPLNSLLEREKSRKVPHSLIRRAIEASATIDVSSQPTAEAAPTTTPATKAQDAATAAEKKKDEDDEDREVFEI